MLVSDEQVEPLSWQWPGKINIANERGYFTGCKAVSFGDVQEMNEFFEATPKVLVVEVLTTATGGLRAFYTKQLDAEEEEEFEHFQRETAQIMGKWRQQRAEQKRKDAEVKEAATVEAARLAEVGAKCEADHGRVIKELREKATKKSLKGVK